MKSIVLSNVVFEEGDDENAFPIFIYIIYIYK